MGAENPDWSQRLSEGLPSMSFLFFMVSSGIFWCFNYGVNPLPLKSCAKSARFFETMQASRQHPRDSATVQWAT